MNIYIYMYHAFWESQLTNEYEGVERCSFVQFIAQLDGRGRRKENNEGPQMTIYQ